MQGHSTETGWADLAEAALANAAGEPSMTVLSGADSVRDAVQAVPAQRPTCIGDDTARDALQRWSLL